jgi:hypothetical protein
MDFFISIENLKCVPPACPIFHHLECASVECSLASVFVVVCLHIVSSLRASVIMIVSMIGRQSCKTDGRIVSEYGTGRARYHQWLNRLIGNSRERERARLAHNHSDHRGAAVELASFLSSYKATVSACVLRVASLASPPTENAPGDNKRGERSGVRESFSCRQSSFWRWRTTTDVKLASSSSVKSVVFSRQQMALEARSHLKLSKARATRESSSTKRS